MRPQVSFLLPPKKRRKKEKRNKKCSISGPISDLESIGYPGSLCPYLNSEAVV
jgi:hypothetical protein